MAAAVAVAAWWYFAMRSPQLAPEGDDEAPPAEEFADVAPESGIDFVMQFLPGEQGENFKINLYDHGCGVVVGDYNGDGHDDVYFLNQLGGNVLFANRGNGLFDNVTSQCPELALTDRICVGGTFSDHDNDGDQDLYVTSTRGGNVLFENLGNGSFRDVTEEAGLAFVGHSQTACFFDADGDGYLDLFVTNTARWTTEEFQEEGRYYAGLADFEQLLASPVEHNILYRNDHDGTFTDVTAQAGLAGEGWGGDVAVADVDVDGDLDLFVTNMFGMSRLYRNDETFAFTDVTKEALVRTSWGAIGCKFFDLDRDGQLDLFVADMHSDMWITANDPATGVEASRKYSYVTGPRIDYEPAAKESESRLADVMKIAYDDVLFGNTVFRATNAGRFEEVSDRIRAETFWPWGVATGDFDNDGWEDVFLPSGMGYPFFYWPSALLMNREGVFADRARDLGIEPPRDGVLHSEPIGGKAAPRSSRAAATADFDGDGRLDLVVNNFNDRPYLFLNRLPRRNYVAFRLTGTRANRDAIGAQVQVVVNGQTLARIVQPAGGYLSQSSKTVHFGLGDAEVIDRVEIRWPGGRVQTLTEPEANRLHEVTEPPPDVAVATGAQGGRPS
jgi:hypothetical protein